MGYKGEKYEDMLLRKLRREANAIEKTTTALKKHQKAEEAHMKKRRK